MSHDTDRLAVLFPGQGVGDAATRELVREQRPDLLALATKLAGDDPFARLGDGTRYAQPAVYCASLAGLERLDRPEGDLYAGHSLGEFAALAAAGAVDDRDGLRAVVTRGALMDEAATAGAPGGMIAVGGDRDQALELAELAGLELANENSPSQYVLTGPDEGIEDARGRARGLGLRAKRLAVAGAFHSVAMEPVVQRFRQRLDEIDFHSARAPVVSGVSAEPFGPDPRDLLAAALTSPVRWVEVLRRLRADGAGRFLDVGPGRVLAGLVGRTLDDVTVQTEREQEAAHA